MNLRPRFREWLPLSTQQLRLRNLVRIEGLNIECESNDANDDALIYYTLHNDKESEALYESEALPQRHLLQKWAEIDSSSNEKLRKSNVNCVCVKVWMRSAAVVNTTEKETEADESELEQKQSREQKCALAKQQQQLSNVCLTPNKLPRPPDERLLFMWGVYFSGLIPLSQQMDAKCRANCLIFQLNGEYFTSPERFSIEGLREQLSHNYQRYARNVPKPSTKAINDAYSINSPKASRSSSPIVFDGADNELDLVRMATSRYTQLECDTMTIRRSYNLEQLLKIQSLQRLHLQKKRDCVDIVEYIKQQSVRCITRTDLRRKPRTTSLSLSSSSYTSHLHHSMGRTLSVLLAEQQKVEPLTLYDVQQLQLQLESLRSKQRFLQAELKTYAKRVTQQRQHLNVLTTTREELANWLSVHQMQLTEDRFELVEHLQQHKLQKQRRRHIVQFVERRMSSLCMELREIYNIRQHVDVDGVHMLYSICGIPFPNLDAYVNDVKYAHGISLDNISPMALSASLGYIAHLVQMIAVIINRPLRNSIVYETSKTRIVDNIKDIPAHATREFPLYTRSTIPSKPVKYAIYLLNQNIAQLCFDITGRRGSMRTPIENIFHIFNILSEIEQNQRELRSDHQTHPDERLVISSHETCETDTCSPHHRNGEEFAELAQNGVCLSKSHSSIDMNHVPVPPPSVPTAASIRTSTFVQLLPTSSQSLTIDGYATTHQRISRSVGSYSDCEDDFGDITEHTYSNSESNLIFQHERS